MNKEYPTIKEIKGFDMEINKGLLLLLLEKIESKLESLFMENNLVLEILNFMDFNNENRKYIKIDKKLVRIYKKIQSLLETIEYRIIIDNYSEEFFEGIFEKKLNELKEKTNKKLFGKGDENKSNFQLFK